jgi:MFS family permease
MDSDEEKIRDIIARVNRIPTWSLPYFYLAIIGIGYFFTFYDISDIGFAMPAIAVQFKISSSSFIYLFLALSVGLIGYAIGSYLIGSLADITGRYRSMILTMGLTALGSFGDAISVNVAMLTVFRFITGIGLGADLNLVSSYVSEFAPPRVRGRITVYTFLIGILGQSVTPFIALLLIPASDVGPGWRYLFVIGGIIAVIALALRFELPESPRWLVQRKKNYAKAEAVLERMETNARKKVGELPKPEPSKVEIVKERFPTLYLFKRPYSTRLTILVVMWFFWYIGNYAFLGDAATLIPHSSVSSSIIYLAVGAIGYPVGAIIMILTADRFERKFVILADTIVWFIGMFIFSTASRDALFVGAFLVSMALGMYLQVAYTYTAESYPTRARSSGFALTDGIGHGGGALGAILLPVLVTTYSFGFGFKFIAVTGLIAGLIALLGPASSRKPLEDVSS